MKENSRVFHLNDKNFQFNFDSFRNLITKRKTDQHIKNGTTEQEIAEHVGLTQSAVHQWYVKANGPADIEVIKSIADFFSVDYQILLKEYTEVSYVDLGIEQIKAVKRVYDAVICFLNEFEQTGGFTTSLWMQFADNGTQLDMIEDKITEYADKRLHEVLFVLKQEYFYLHDLPIYDMLFDYIVCDLYDTYDGKLSYAYRFEAQVDNNPSTEDDYEKAINTINNIIEPIRQRKKS